ncbi:MAG: hypothetical protein ACREDM_05430 [Methylocella sp.]
MADSRIGWILIQQGEQLLKGCHVCSSSAWFQLRWRFAAQAGEEIARVPASWIAIAA